MSQRRPEKKSPLHSYTHREGKERIAFVVDPWSQPTAADPPKWEDILVLGKHKAHDPMSKEEEALGLVLRDGEGWSGD